MAYLNANIPVQYAQIKREYLYDLKKHHGEVEDCIIFGISCITGRAILWHALMENGAIFIVSQYGFIQRGYEPKFPQKDLMNWSFGILLVIILLLLLMIF